MANVRGRSHEYVTTKSGDVLTEIEIEALATEAAVGYELRQATRRRAGRPSLEAGVSPRVSFRTNSTLYRAARERAAREGRSVSALAREAMERYVSG